MIYITRPWGGIILLKCIPRASPWTVRTAFAGRHAETSTSLGVAKPVLRRAAFLLLPWRDGVLAGLEAQAIYNGIVSILRWNSHKMRGV